MALEGTLRDFSLADIFQLIGIQKKTGVLTLKNAGAVVTVSFLTGNVVSADSAKKNLEDRLGSVLVRSGRISAARLEEALRVQRETLQRLGYILIKGGFIQQADLREALRLQITQVVYRLFRWQDGEYHFSQEETVEYDRENFTPIGAESILMEGIRMIDEWPIIERKIPSFDLVFRRTRPDVRPTIVAREEDAVEADLDSALTGHEPARRDSPDGVRLTQEESRIFELVDGRASVQEIVDRSRLGEFEACRILYELLSRNLVSRADAPAQPHVPVAGRPVRRGSVLERLGYAVLAAAALLSVTTMGYSPLSGMPRDLISAESVDLMWDLVARNRVQRLDEAIQVYYLQKGFYPDDLRELVKGRLVYERALRDPWGRGFGFIVAPEGYRIISYDHGGVENLARSVQRGRVPPAAPVPREQGAGGTRAARRGDGR